MKTAIVTGAGGFVGRAVVSELKKNGVEVFSVFHTEKGLKSESDNHCTYCDMADYSNLPKLIQARDVDVFYHFAWSGTSGSLRGDDRIQLANVLGTCDAVRAAAEIRCRKFVFASSIMEYEVEAEIKAMKNPPVSSIYSTAKMTADYMGRILASSYDIEYISALISNIYGPGEKSPRLINSVIRKLLRGEHVALSSGEQMYDFIFISDAAKMFSAVGESGISGRTYYIGNRTVQPLKTFLMKLRDIVSPESVLGFGELTFNGVSLSYEEFDKEILYRDTGIEAEVSFSEGIRKTRDWIIREDFGV